MVNSRMSFVKAISIAFIFVFDATGITDTDCSYTEQAFYGFANVARTDTSRPEFAIPSSNAEWYSEGMQLFAYHLDSAYWEKRTLKWAITNDSSNMPRQSVEDVMREAFAKWAAETPFTFEKVSSGDQQPDIRISFKPMEVVGLSMTKLPEEQVIDSGGADISFANPHNWTDVNGEYWHNLRFAALHEIGHALGLDESRYSGAVMFEDSPGFTSNDEPALNEDDIYKIRAMYGPPTGASKPFP